MMLLQGGQLTSRAVPRLRGGPPWREEADFDTFYMSFRWERSLPLLAWEFPLENSISVVNLQGADFGKYGVFGG